MTLLLIRKWNFICHNWCTTQHCIICNVVFYTSSYSYVIIKYMIRPPQDVLSPTKTSQGLEECSISSGYGISKSQFSLYGYWKYSRYHKKYAFNGLVWLLIIFLSVPVSLYQQYSVDSCVLLIMFFWVASLCQWSKPERYARNWSVPTGNSDKTPILCTFGRCTVYIKWTN